MSIYFVGVEVLLLQGLPSYLSDEMRMTGGSTKVFAFNDLVTHFFHGHESLKYLECAFACFYWTVSYPQYVCIIDTRHLTSYFL